MRLMTYFALVLFFPRILVAEEVDRVVAKNTAGRTLTTITYKNEHDGMIKKELYGEGPKYTDRVLYFDDSNSHYFSVCCYYDLDYSDAFYPDGKSMRGLFVFQDNNPRGIIRSEFKRKGQMLKNFNYYNKGNNENLKEEIIISTNNVNTLYKKRYWDSEDKSDSLIEKTYLFNFSGDVVEIEMNYRNDEDFFSKQINEYNPPIFSEKKDKPIRVIISFVDNPAGLSCREIMYDDKGWRMSLEYYDPEKTKDRFTRIMQFYEGDILRRKIVYFDDVLLKGQIYFISSWYNDDGSMKSAELYDKNDQIIK